MVVKKDLFVKNMLNMINKKGTSGEDRAKLIFFDFFDSLKNKDELFDAYFDVTRSIPSKSTNGFVSIISLKMDRSLQFILKTPKSTGGDNPETEYKIAKELTRVTINSKKIPDCIVKTWASVKCIPNYKDKGKKSESLGETACMTEKEREPVTHIIMEYIKGDTLHNLVTSQKITNNESMVILGVINCCLHLLRLENGFTHYDLHSGNIMLEQQKETEYNFNINNSEYKFTSKYRVVFIDFGRTYIRPFIFNNKKVDLSKTTPVLFLYPREYHRDIYDRFRSIMLTSLTSELEFQYKVQDILKQYVEIPVGKTEYSLREKTIIVSSTIILDFMKQSYKHVSKVSDEEFMGFVFDKFFKTGKNIILDVIPQRENNVCDILKITMGMLENINMSGRNNINSELAHKEILLNYPFLLPYQNFLPYAIVDRINSKKISGIFGINGPNDIINLLVKTGLLPDKVIVKLPKRGVVIDKKHTIIKVEYPDKNNKANDIISKNNLAAPPQVKPSGKSLKRQGNFSPKEVEEDKRSALIMKRQRKFSNLSKLESPNPIKKSKESPSNILKKLLESLKI